LEGILPPPPAEPEAAGLTREKQLLTQKKMTG